MVEVIDYRVSRIVVLCKDCGQDVGLYPARHKCGIPTSEALYTVPKNSRSSDNSTSCSNNSNSKIPSSNSSNYNNSESYNLWNKFMNSAATAVYNVAGDSDNESEKDDWDGETHISRILREYYENKGGDLPDWLYDSDSKFSYSLNNSYAFQTERTSKIQILTNRNGNSPLLEVDINRNRQPKSYNDSTRDISPIPNHISAKMDGGRGKSVPPPNSFNNAYNSLPKNSRRIIDDQTNVKNSNYIKNSDHNSLPSRRQQPPFTTTSDDYNVAKRSISSKKSYNQLNSREQYYDSTSSPNRDIRYNNYNNNIQEGNGDWRDRQGIPLSRVPNKNYIRGNYF